MNVQTRRILVAAALAGVVATLFLFGWLRTEKLSPPPPGSQPGSQSQPASCPVNWKHYCATFGGGCHTTGDLAAYPFRCQGCERCVVPGPADGGEQGCGPKRKARCDKTQCVTIADVQNRIGCEGCEPCVVPGAATCGESMRTACSQMSCNADTGSQACVGCEACVGPMPKIVTLPRVYGGQCQTGMCAPKSTRLTAQQLADQDAFVRQGAAPTEMPTEAPTDAPTEMPTETTTEMPTETTTEMPTETTTEMPVEEDTADDAPEDGSEPGDFAADDDLADEGDFDLADEDAEFEFFG